MYSCMCGKWVIGGVAKNILAVWPEAVQSNKLSLCRHCHPADGTFNSRDTLVHAISPTILAEVSKEVEMSEVAS